MPVFLVLMKSNHSEAVVGLWNAKRILCQTINEETNLSCTPSSLSATVITHKFAVNSHFGLSVEIACFNVTSHRSTEYSISEKKYVSYKRCNKLYGRIKKRMKKRAEKISVA